MIAWALAYLIASIVCTSIGLTLIAIGAAVERRRRRRFILRAHSLPILDIEIPDPEWGATR